MDDLDLGQTIRGFAPGQKLFGRYTLTRMLGRGGMGVVWLARDEHLDVDVALKALPEMIALDRGAVDDMKRETRRSRELSHKNIVKVYQFELEGEMAAISMEYVDGETLANLKTEQPGKCFSHTQLEAWLPELCDALDYAHTEAKMVHRDLKPANVMLNSRGRIKIADFGIASTIVDSVSQVSMRHGSSGTPPYMSPQQLNGERPTHLDDIYSLGVTLYDLLTGKPPFYRGNASTIAHQIQSVLAPRMVERRAELENDGEPIPQHWERAIAACLSKDPAHRPQSAKELLARLEGNGGYASVPQPPPLPAQPELQSPSSPQPQPQPQPELQPQSPPPLPPPQSQPKPKPQRPPQPKPQPKPPPAMPAHGTSPAHAKVGRPRILWPWIVLSVASSIIIVLVVVSTLLIGFFKQLPAGTYEFVKAAAYESGMGVTKDLSKAVELYQKAADQGHALAQNDLGTKYESGAGVTKDVSKAVELYQKSADQGNASGQTNLGRMYENGRGVTKDLTKAVDLYQRAADQGFAPAQNSLGRMYEYGTGVTKDLNKAVELYRKSADQGNASGQAFLGTMYEYGRGVTKDVSKAVELYQKSADQGNAFAQGNLGGMYEEGTGVTKDMTKAIELYQKAADQGSDYARNALERLNANNKR